MQLYELLSFSVSQCNFVLAKIMEDITICGLCMRGLVHPFWKFSHVVDRELFTAYGWSPSCDYIICSIIVQATHLSVKVLSVLFLSKTSSMQMRRLYLHAGNKLTFSPIQAWWRLLDLPSSPPPPPTPHLFLKISSEHFKVTVTYIGQRFFFLRR